MFKKIHSSNFLIIFLFFISASLYAQSSRSVYTSELVKTTLSAAEQGSFKNLAFNNIHKDNQDGNLVRRRGNSKLLRLEVDSDDFSTISNNRNVTSEKMVAVRITSKKKLVFSLDFSRLNNIPDL